MKSGAMKLCKTLNAPASQPNNVCPVSRSRTYLPNSIVSPVTPSTQKLIAVVQWTVRSTMPNRLPREGREHVADAFLAPPGAETSRVHEAVEAKHMSQRRNDRLQRLAALSGGDQRRQDRRHKPRALQHDLPRSQTVQHRFLDTLTELVARLPHRWTEPVIDDSLAIVPEHAYCDFSDALRNSRWCTVAALRSARQRLARSGGG